MRDLTLSIHLPDSLHTMAKNVAREDPVFMNQFIASAVSEKVAALTLALCNRTA